MNIQWFVRNPIKVSMLFLGLLLMGVLSYRKLPLNLFPDLDTPRITVIAETKGIPPEQAEKLLTQDFERQLSSIRGVSSITSYTRERSIVLQIDFRWGQDMEFAYLDVKKSVDPLESNQSVEKIDVLRFDPNAAPLMTLAFTGEADRVQLTNFIENSLKPKLETVEGVAYVRENGAARQEIRIAMNEDSLSQYRLTTAQILQALKNYNVSSAGGAIVEGNEEMLLKFTSRFKDLDDIRKCIVTVVESHPIYLQDLGKIEIRPIKEEVIVHQDGIRSVSLDIYREPDANAVFTARRVREMVQLLNSRGACRLKIALDQSVEVEAAINEVVNTALIGMALATIVLLLFLRNITATIIVSLAIPISIVCTFSLMYFQHLSLNIMTLGGLALAAGMLIDNGIVVIENIFRHRQEGKGKAESSIVGTSEVAMAISASTLTCAVVFVPLIYVHGIAGILFKDQALTVVYSHTVSLLVALALIPMLSAWSGKSRIATSSGLNRVYGSLLGNSLRWRWPLMALFAVIMFLSWQLGRRIPSELFPESVNGRLSMQLELPAGSQLDQTQSVVQRFENMLMRMKYTDMKVKDLMTCYEAWKIDQDDKAFIKKTQPLLAKLPAYAAKDWYRTLQNLAKEEDEKLRTKQLKKVDEGLHKFFVIESISSVIGADSATAQMGDDKIHGAHTARMEISLNPDLLRSNSTSNLIALLNKEAARTQKLTCSFESRSDFLQQMIGRSRGDVVVELHAEKLPDLVQSVETARQKLAAIPGFANVRTNLVPGEETYMLEPDSDAMLRAGFTAEDISQQVESYLKGSSSDRLKLEQGDMDVTVANERSGKEGLRGLMDLLVISKDGAQAQIADLVKLQREKGIAEVMRVNQEKTLLVMADLDGLRYQDAIERIQSELNQMPWKSGSSWNFSGEELKRRESFQNLLFALIIAIVLIYMVIAATLESIIHPITIMISIPFAFTGVVGGFLITGLSLNLMGYTGIVMLTGIVVNNAIVLLDRVHQLRQSGETVGSALVLAGKQRMRPILMTFLTAVLALLPLAMGFGNGAEFRRPMAIALIGGLTSSTLLTLLILPAMYQCIEDGLAWLRLLFARRPAPAVTPDEELPL